MTKPSLKTGDDPLNVDSILVSEYAGLSGTSLSVFKTFNQINLAGPPYRMPMLFVSVIIHAHRSEKGSEHELEVRLIDENRKPVRVLDKLEVRFSNEDPPPGIPLRHTHVVGQVNLEFPRSGPYAIEVYLDGTYSAAASLYVGLKR